MAHTQASPLEPNPGFEKVSFLNKLQALTFLFSIPYTILTVSIRRYMLRRKNDIPFKGDLVRSLTRSAPFFLPLSIARASGIRRIPSVLNSPRFSAHKEELYQYVIQKDFAGYWICSGAPGAHREPSKCDMVLYHIHGGGYQLGHPGAALQTLLRIVELAAERGVTIAVFSLNYSLSPEAKAPKQVAQATAAYRYLLRDMQIELSNIAMMGDSAGGHLVLHFLARLSVEHLSRPGAGAFLVAPWVDLWCSNEEGTYIQNKHRDYLVRKDLINGASALFGSDRPKPSEPYSNFHRPLPDGLSWSIVMPSRVWIGVGDHDLFCGDVQKFCDILKQSGVSVELSVAKGKVHTWELIEDILSMNKYISTTASSLPNGVMEGAARLADKILAKPSN